MPTYFAHGSPTTVISDDDLRAALISVYQKLGTKKKVLVVPPDFTRFNSRAGILTQYTYQHYKEALVDVLPALGTHVPSQAWRSDEERAALRPGRQQDALRQDSAVDPDWHR